MLSLYPWTKLSKDFIWAINKKLTINNKFKETFQLGNGAPDRLKPELCHELYQNYFNSRGAVTNCVKRKNKRSSQIKWRYWLITDTANKKVGT